MPEQLAIVGSQRAELAGLEIARDLGRAGAAAQARESEALPADRAVAGSVAGVAGTQSVKTRTEPIVVSTSSVAAPSPITQAPPSWRPATWTLPRVVLAVTLTLEAGSS